MGVDFHNADVPCEGRGYAEIGARWRTPYMCDDLEKKNVIMIA